MTGALSNPTVLVALLLALACFLQARARILFAPLGLLYLGVAGLMAAWPLVLTGLSLGGIFGLLSEPAFRQAALVLSALPIPAAVILAALAVHERQWAALPWTLPAAFPLILNALGVPLAPGMS